ncbi:MAG: GntR family transcriptional regulator [Gemmatimonadales bacterium]|nr:GntR family transcriptional regulator [Gemmatimonadales bacterium]
MGPKRKEVADALRERIFTGLHLGALKHGARLPAVRELAHLLQVDPRVVLAACRDLEGEGVVEIRGRSGIYVAPDRTRSAEFMRRREDWIIDVFMQGQKHGIPAARLPEQLRRYLDTLRLTTACIECNADQIEELCHELHTDYGLQTVPIDCEKILSSTRWPAELLSADVFVTTHFHAHEIEPIARQLEKPIVVVGLRTALFSEIGRMLAEGPVYVVVVDVRFGTKLHRIFASNPALANLHVLVHGQEGFAERLARIPKEAPVYLTRTARRELGEAVAQLPRTPELRSFSPDSAGPLLAFIVRANAAALSGLRA